MNSKKIYQLTPHFIKPKWLMVLLGVFTFINVLSAQKVLVVGFNYDTPDGVILVALEDLPDTEVVFVTETPYDAATNTFDRIGAGVGAGTWQVQWTGTWSKGTVIQLQGNPLVGTSGPGGPASPSATSPYGHAVSFSNEGFSVYTASNVSDPSATPTEIYSFTTFSKALSSDPDPNDDGDCPCSSGFISVDLNANIDQAQYRPSLRTDGTTETTAEFTNAANYDVSTSNVAHDLTAFTSIDISPAIVCPTVGAVSASETAVCAGAPFNVTATGLIGLDATTNTDQDYGIRFVAFTGTPADPYTGGTGLGTVPFGSLTGGNTTAALVGANLTTAGSHEIYAVLSPTPADGTCRPSAMTTITVNALPVVTLNMPADQDEFCINDATVLISLAGSPTSVGVYSGPGVTDLGNAGISFTFNPAMAGVGTHTVTYTFTDGNGCMNTATDQIVVNPIPNVEVTSTDAICTASNGTATASVTDPIGVITYAWSTGAQLLQV